MIRHTFLLLTFAVVPRFAFPQAPPDLVAAHVQRLNGGDAVDRSTAATALGALGKEAGPAIPALVRALGDRDPFVARAAVAALCRVGEAAVPPLVQALASRDKAVRHGAAVALSRIG